MEELDLKYAGGVGVNVPAMKIRVLVFRKQDLPPGYTRQNNYNTYRRTLSQ